MTPPLCPFAPLPLELHTIPPEDPATYAMIQKADTIGVFQIESRAQMSMLPRLKPKEFYDLVIEVAIVRPGPIQGDMVHPYLKRRNKEEPVLAVHPSVDKVLERTLGVPLFQEQCMALAVEAAGFTAGEADQLRRAMAAWKRKGDLIYRFGHKLITGMVDRGIKREFAERCFEQIKGFSEYGFPESHAASFALLVYVSAWLKRHYPAHFAAGLLNSQPMGFYAPAQLVRDAKEHGVRVLPIDVRHSDWDCTIQGGGLRLGMRLVNGLRNQDAEKITSARNRGEQFACVESLWRVAGVSCRGLRRLAAADAFGSMGLSRQQALWSARKLRDEHLPLFEQAIERPDEPVPLPVLHPSRHVVLDYQATGLSLKAHPVSFIRERLRGLHARPCRELLDERLSPNGERVRVGGLVLVRQRPGTAKDVTFMTIEDETGIANLVVWSRVYHRYRAHARSTLLLAYGRVQRQGEVVHVVVDRLQRLSGQVDEVAIKARNFH
jgi:error-prone DNA polymerase